MSREIFEKLWVCSACGEEVMAKSRKWTCPCCGAADTFELSEGQFDDEYGDEDEDY